MSKTRLDMLIMERGLAGSRQKAQAMIMEGRVYVNGQKESKSGAAFAPDALIEIRGEDLRYVSRGGLKLEKAVDVFGLDLNGLVCMDVGASTGGFTDCMLQNGAARVYAVDVGYGQFSWKLRQDSRVVVMEKTNVRYLEPEQIPEPVGFAGCDVSFISLTKIIPAVWNVLSEGALMVCLIKPQFEAGREKVGKGGIVRSPVCVSGHLIPFVSRKNRELKLFPSLLRRGTFPLFRSRSPSISASGCFADSSATFAISAARC